MSGAKTPKAKTWRSRQRFGSALVCEHATLYGKPCPIHERVSG